MKCMKIPVTKQCRAAMCDLTGGLLFPLYTLILVLQDNPLTTNLSWVGNGLGYRLPVLVWAVLGTLTYRQLNCRLAAALKTTVPRFSFLSYLLMILAVLVPYLPQQYPLLASLHILLGYLAFAALNLTIIAIALRGRAHNWPLCSRLLRWIVVILMTCMMMLMVFMSINSLLELFYACTMSWTLIFFRRCSEHQSVRQF